MPTHNQVLPIQGFDDHDSFSLEPAYCPNLRNVRSLRNRITRSPGGVLLCPPPTPGTTPGFGMVTGGIEEATSTGNQVITHNLGTTPKALILFSSAPFSPTFGFNARSQTSNGNVGFTDGTTSRSVATQTNNGGDSARRWSTDLYTRIFSDGTVESQAAFVSWNSTTFTINWTTVDPFQQSVLGYAIFGSAAISAKVIPWTLGTSGGNQAVTGAGFQPEVVLHIHNNMSSAAASANAAFGFGAMDTQRQWSHSWASTDTEGPNITQAGRYTNRTIHLVSPSGGLVYGASLVSLDADGFTVSRGNPPASGVLVASLVMEGFDNVRVQSPSGSPSVGTAPFQQTFSGIGFQPTSVLTSYVPATNANVANIDYMMGFTDGVNQTVSAVSVVNGNLDAASTMRNNSIVLDIQGSGFDLAASVQKSATDYTFNSDGYTFQVITGSEANHDSIAFQALGNTNEVGVIRNYADLIVGGAVPTEDLVMLTNKSAFIYSPVTTGTGIWTPTSEVYTGDEIMRFSIANGTDSTYGAVAAWSQNVDNIRYYDGTTFGDLIQSGTNHSARIVLSFNNRIVSVRPIVGGVEQLTQIRWSVNGDFADWSGTGSGTLEVVETSNQPLTGGFVLGGRCYLTRAREVIELIATGSLSPVFQTEQRVAGVGCIATHSIALGDVYAFWLGPDEVYQWDGAQLRAVGGRTYNTICQIVPPTRLGVIQGTVYEPDSQYWLLVPPYVFIYDYRRDIWDWDDSRSFQAIGRFYVQTRFQADINHSEFVVLGDSAVQTIRSDPAATNFLGAPIDSYFETKDYTAEELLQSFGFRVTLWDVNSLRELRFQGPPGNIVEVGCSVDRGATYVDLQDVTVNQFGVGVAWFQRPFSQIRFRFRNFRLDEGYQLHGTWATDVETAGNLYSPT